MLLIAPFVEEMSIVGSRFIGFSRSSGRGPRLRISAYLVSSSLAFSASALLSSILAFACAKSMMLLLSGEPSPFAIVAIFL